MERERKEVDLRGFLVSNVGADIMQTNLNEHIDEQLSGKSYLQNVNMKTKC